MEVNKCESNKPSSVKHNGHISNEKEDIDHVNSNSHATRTFFRTTTTHGLSRIHRTTSCRKIIWLTLFLLNGTGLLYCLADLSIWYTSFAVDTKTEFIQKRELVFPSVTVCNMNPVKYSSLHLSPRLSKILQRWGVRVPRGTNRDKRSTNAKCMVTSSEGDRCYWMGELKPMIHSEAKTVCAKHGAYLVSAKAVEETKYLYDAMMPFSLFGNPRVFIDLRHQVGSDQFLWRGKTPITWSAWAPGQPKILDNRIEYCVTSSVKTPYNWETVSCSAESSYFVCEYNYYEEFEPDTTTLQYQTSESDAPTTIEQTTTTSEPTTSSSPTIGTPSPSTASPTRITKSDPLPTQAYSRAQQSRATRKIITTTPLPTTTLKYFPDFKPIYKPIPGPGSAFPERKPLTAQYIFESEVLEYLAEAPIDLRKALGYTFGEFVLDCHFAGKSCMTRKFASFFDAQHGNCFVFNSDWLNITDESLLVSYRPGRSNGLELIINIDQNEYIPNLIDGAGAVVVIHPSTRMPFPEDEGVLAKPGQMTSIGITKVRVDRMDGVYGSCNRVTRNSSKNVFEEEHNVNYSVNACAKTCYQYHVIASCGCADAQYPIRGVAFSSLKEGKILACDSQNVTEEDCVYNMTLQYNQNNLNCDCPNTCSEDLFKHLVSTGRWPTRYLYDDIVDRYGSKMKFLKNNPNGKSQIKENLLKIEVYFNAFNYKHISEKPKYTLYRYISDLGATLGLWLGMSALSIFEVLEFIWDGVIILCCRNWRQKKQRHSMVSPLLPEDPVPLEEKSLPESNFIWGKQQVNGMLKWRRTSVRAECSEPRRASLMVELHPFTEKRPSLTDTMPSVENSKALGLHKFSSSRRMSPANLPDPISASNHTVTYISSLPTRKI